MQLFFKAFYFINLRILKHVKQKTNADNIHKISEEGGCGLSLPLMFSAEPKTLILWDQLSGIKFCKLVFCNAYPYMGQSGDINLECRFS